MFRKIIKPAQSLLTTTKKHFANLHNIPNKVAKRNDAFPSDQQSIINSLRKESSSLSSSSILDNLTASSKLSTTSFSKTHRVFADDLNRYMSLKTIHLHSPHAWEQMNLILRQKALKKKALADVHSIYFNEKNRIANVLSECSSKVLSDSLRIRTQSKVPWKGDELTLLSWQILHQLNAMQQLGAELHPQSSISPQNLFIDVKANLLKLHDFGDFGLESKHTQEKVHSMLENFTNSPPLLNETILSLVNMISPEMWCRDGEAARRYLETHHSDFMYQLELMESKLREFDEGSKEDFASRLENEILKFIGDQKLVDRNAEEYARKKEKDQDAQEKKDHIITSENLKQTDQTIKSNETQSSSKIGQVSSFQYFKDTTQLMDEVFKEIERGTNYQIEKQNITEDSKLKKTDAQGANASQTLPPEDVGFKVRMNEALAKDGECQSAVMKILKRIWKILNLKNSFLFSLWFAIGTSAFGAFFGVLLWVETLFEGRENVHSQNEEDFQSNLPEQVMTPVPLPEHVKFPIPNQPKQTFKERLRSSILFYIFLLLCIF